MPECNLIVDSCCDLPAELIEREGITLLKFPYIIGNGTYDDDLFKTITPAEFYGGMRKGATPSTAQLSVPLLTETFEAAAGSGRPTVYLSFSSGLSGSFDVAELVADQVRANHPEMELYLVDTLLASAAEGVLIAEAINQWSKGLTAKELAAWAEEAKYFVDCEFMVEDLETLRRGGRIPGSVAVAGAALDVKPLLTIDVDGKLQLIGVSRGRKKGIKQLVEYYVKNSSHEGQGRYVVLSNADCPKDAERLKEALLKADDDVLIIESPIGPVIGSHVGPGMLALAFWGSDKRENLSVADKIARKVKGGRNK